MNARCTKFQFYTHPTDRTGRHSYSFIERRKNKMSNKTSSVPFLSPIEISLLWRKGHHLHQKTSQLAVGIHRRKMMDTGVMMASIASFNILFNLLEEKYHIQKKIHSSTFFIVLISFSFALHKMIYRRQFRDLFLVSIYLCSRYNTKAFSPPRSSTTSGSRSILLEMYIQQKQYARPILSSSLMDTETISESASDFIYESEASKLFEPKRNSNKKSNLNESKNDWSFVDKVYLITCPNADPNSERLNKAKVILDKVGLLDQVEVKCFDTDDEDRIRGCYTSHISVLRDGLRDIQLQSRNDAKPISEDWWGSLISVFDNSSNGSTQRNGNVENGEVVSSSKPSRQKCILVLEDNLEFSGNLNNEMFDSITDFLEKHEDDVDMIHLSYIPYVPNLKVSRTDNKNIVRLSTGQSSALGTTAYVITERAMQTLIQEDVRNGFRAPIPDVMAEQFPESRYSAYPAPFLRAPKTKSLVNPQLDDLRELLFLPPVVAQFQNVLALTGLATNTIFFVTIGALVIAGANAGMAIADALNQFVSTGSYDGNIFFLLVDAIFTTLSIGIIAQGAALAPKPPEEAPTDSEITEVVA